MFSISSQLTLDPKQFESGITKAGNLIQLFGQQSSLITRDASRGMDKYDSTLRNTNGTIQGLSNRLKELTQKLSMVEVGSKRFQILSAAVNETKEKLNEAKKSTSDFKNKTDETTRSIDLQAGALSALSAISLGKIVGGVKSMMDAAQQAESQMIGLSKVIENRFGSQSVPKAIDMVSELSSELGLTKEAVIGTMKNLSSMNFTLEQQAELIRGATDIAVDNRQSHYDLSESVKVWSDGLKNNNSTLSDSIGISENIGAQYKRLGIETDSLTDKTAGLGARQALVNDFMGQFAVFSGRASENIEGYAGATNLLDKSSTELSVTLGSMYKESVTPIIAAFARGVSATSSYAKTMGSFAKASTLAATASLGVVGGIYSIGTALNATGVVASRAWLRILGPMGLAVAGIVLLNEGFKKLSTKQSTEEVQKFSSELDKSGKSVNYGIATLQNLQTYINGLDVNNPRASYDRLMATIRGSDSQFIVTSGLIDKLGVNMTRNKEIIQNYINGLKEQKKNQTETTDALGKTKKGMEDFQREVKKTTAALGDLGGETGDGADEIKDFWTEWQNATGPLTAAESSMKNVYTQATILNKALTETGEEARNSFQKFAAGAKLGLTVINELGQSVTNFFNAQAQLASVIQQNNSQNLAFLNQAIAAQIDQQTQVALDQADSEISIIESKIREIEETEQEYRDRSNQEYEEWLAERKRMWEEFVNGRIQLDEELFRTESEKLQADIFARRDALLAQNNDEVSQAMIKEKALSDLEIARANLQDELKAKREEELAAEREKLDAEEAAKKEQVDADILTNEQKAETEKTALLARQQEIEDGKAAIQAESDQKKKEADRVMRLIEWQSGKVAFEANKKAQMATAAMGAAQSITQGAITAAAIMAGYWTAAAAQAGPTMGVSMVTTGPIGMALGPIVGSLVAGTGIASSAIAMKAAQAPQYPPPPIFAKGGMVGGMPHSLGGTLIEAERNEFVVNKDATMKNLNLLNAINSGKDPQSIFGNQSSTVSNFTIQTLNLHGITNAKELMDELEKEFYWKSERV